MNLVVFVNGPARAGKDTAVGFMRDYLTERGFLTTAYSSIDPVREMLVREGIDVSAKTEADRLLLATLGKALEDHCQYRSKACVFQILAGIAPGRDTAIFLHVREPDTITRIRSRISEVFPGATVRTCLVDSMRATPARNPADRSVFDMTYNGMIVNNRGLDELELACRRFVIETCGIDKIQPCL